MSPTVDDPIVGWFGDAGTSMIGKTATPEFGLPCYTEPDGRPPAVTPWDPTRSAGGSSGGAAAAVAAGIAPLAHASDGGGSIRIPASACGLVGLKVSRGLISSGARPPGPGLGTDGVVSRTVRDTGLALDVLAGARPGDTYWAPVAAGGYLAACDQPAGRLRVGLLTTPVIADADVHPACLDAVARAGLLLEGLGHEVTDAPVAFPADRWQAFTAVWSVGRAGHSVAARGGCCADAVDPMAAGIRPVRRVGWTTPARWPPCRSLTREVALTWADFDVVVSPTLAQPPAPLGSLRDDDDPARDFDGPDPVHAVDVGLQPDRTAGDQPAAAHRPGGRGIDAPNCRSG